MTNENNVVELSPLVSNVIMLPSSSFSNTTSTSTSTTSRGSLLSMRSSSAVTTTTTGTVATDVSQDENVLLNSYTKTNSNKDDDNDNDDETGYNPKKLLSINSLNDGRIYDSSSTIIVTTTSSRERKIRIVIELVWGITIFSIGWFVPRYYMYNETTIITKEPPYQKLGNDLIVVDSTLNNPLIETPIIPSNLLIYTSVHIPLVLIAIITYLFHPIEESVIAVNNNNNNNNNNTDSTIVSLSKSNTTLIRYHKVIASISCFLTAIGVCEGITQILKLFIQRRRPNFYNLCQFNYTTLKCSETNIHRLREGNFSFPSGHSSLSSCAMIVITWFLLAKIHVYFHPNNNNNYNNNQNRLSRILRSTNTTSSSRKQQQQHQRHNCTSSVGTIIRICCCTSTYQRMIVTLIVWIVCPGWAIFVGATRLVDKWHHPSDVVAGLILGNVVGSIVYHIWYPSPIYFFNGYNNQLITTMATTATPNDNNIVSLPYTITVI